MAGFPIPMSSPPPKPALYALALDPLRRWVDAFQPASPLLARWLVVLIPGRCPFERDLVIFGRKLVHIPPLCRFNPLYEQLAALRFRSLCLLEARGHKALGAQAGPG